MTSAEVGNDFIKLQDIISNGLGPSKLFSLDWLNVICVNSYGSNRIFTRIALFSFVFSGNMFAFNWSL